MHGRHVSGSDSEIGRKNFRNPAISDSHGNGGSWLKLTDAQRTYMLQSKVRHVRVAPGSDRHVHFTGGFTTGETLVEGERFDADREGVIACQLRKAEIISCTIGQHTGRGCSSIEWGGYVNGGELEQTESRTRQEMEVTQKLLQGRKAKMIRTRRQCECLGAVNVGVVCVFQANRHTELR